MKICYVNAFFDEDIASGTEYVDRIYTVRELAREQASLGAEVHVLVLFHRDEDFVRDGVRYWFVRPGRFFEMAGRAVSRLRPSTPLANYQLATRLVQRLRRIRPDVVHFFGLTLDLNLWLVSRAASALRMPLVVQYNGGRPPRGRVRRATQRENLRRVDRLLFTTVEHADHWREGGLPIDPARVVPCMETSSILRWQPRDQAREVTGMDGDPVFLWTGRLHPEKDPLTALRGFARIVAGWPEARLYLYYLTDELLPVLQRFTERRPHLAGRVHFCGRADHDQIGPIYNSADFLLQASSREAMGIAVMEAMSCGVIPVVTDIPSFRSMTAAGQYGLLYPSGDDESLARQVLSIDRDEIPERSRSVREHFDQQLSFPALARHLDGVYRELAGAAGAEPVPAG